MLFTCNSCGRTVKASWDSNPNSGDYKRCRCPSCGISEKSEFRIIDGKNYWYHFEKFTTTPKPED